LKRGRHDKREFDRGPAFPALGRAAGNANFREGRAVKLTGWRPLHRNTLRGFVSIELAIGLQITDIAVHSKGERSWVGLPARPQLEDGRHRVDPTTGKPVYTAVLVWKSRAIADQFSTAVLSELVKHYPHALGGDMP
jgi:hypothetical protein